MLKSRWKNLSVWVHQTSFRRCSEFFKIVGISNTVFGLFDVRCSMSVQNDCYGPNFLLFGVGTVRQFLKLLLSAVRIYCLELGGPWLLLILFERFSIQCFQHTGCTYCATPKLSKKVLHIGDIVAHLGLQCNRCT